MALFGNTGEGKTLTLTLIGLTERARGRTVYANYHIAGINCDSINRDWKPSQYPDNHFYLKNPDRLIYLAKNNMFARNSLVLLDEAYAWGLDARETMTGAQDSRKGRLALTHAILQSRKSHFQILHTEQLLRSVDNRLRFLTEFYLFMRGIAYRIINGEKINVEFCITPFQNLGIWGFRELPKLYVHENVFWALNGYYDTYEQISLETETLEKAEEKDIPKQKPPVMNNIRTVSPVAQELADLWREQLSNDPPEEINQYV